MNINKISEARLKETKENLQQALIEIEEVSDKVANLRRTIRFLRCSIDKSREALVNGDNKRAIAILVNALEDDKYKY